MVGVFGEMVGPRISLTEDKMQFKLACSGCRFREFWRRAWPSGSYCELAAKEFCRVLGNEHLADELEHLEVAFGVEFNPRVYTL